MPLLVIPGLELDLPRNLALLDTSVLVALADEYDNGHDQAEAVVEESQYDWLVVPPVVVEACGLLGSRRGPGVVLRLLSWILTPGTGVTLLPDPNHPVELREKLYGHVGWMRKYEIDYVDAYLMQIADILTRTFQLKPHVPVLTFDTRDYFKCSQQGYLFSLFEMKERYLIEFS